MKILGGETNLNAPISVGSARVVRVFNSDSSNLLVTRKTYGGTTVGTFIVPAGEVVYCEKDYTDTLEGSANLKVTQVAFSPMMSFVSEDSAGPTYTHSVSATAVDEGGNFTTTITTTNVADGTNLYWELTGVQSADFSSGALTGTASISSNSATFSHTVDEDLTTEGTETATIKVYSDSGRNTQVGNTLTVTISDTSTTPVVQDFSVDFDDNNDSSPGHLTLPQNSDFNFGGDPWTIECWVYPSNIANTTGGKLNILWNSGGNNNNTLFTHFTNAQLSVGNQNAYIVNTAATFEDSRWYHLAFTRDGSNNLRVFQNGIKLATVSDSTNWICGGPVLIGRSSVDSQSMNGLVSNFRVVKGEALYTDTFTPPFTRLTTTSQSATASNVKLLCCNKSTETGSTVAPDGLTANDDPTTGTATIGGTANTPYVDFDDDDGLNGAPDSDLSIGTSAFTIEYWVYLDNAPGTGSPSYARMFQLDGPSGNSDSKNLQITINPSTKAVQVWAYDGSIAVTIGGSTNMQNAWHHVAVVRDSNQLMTLFIDGTSEGTQSNATQSFDPNSGSPRVRIGSYDNGETNGVFNGKISNLRVLVGTALYTSNFTTPNPPLTNITNTKLLCCQSSDSTTTAAVGPDSISEVNPNNIDSSTADPFTDDWSVEFDGDDYLTIADSTDFDLDSSDFTIECWYNPDTNPSWCGLIAQWPNGNYNVTNSWVLEPVGNTLSFYYCNTAGNLYNANGPGSVQTNQWQHCAVTRSGNTINVWLNGSKGADHTIVGTMQNSTVNVDIGGNVAGSGYVDGNLSNIRLTKGQALYTSNFTPSTSALTTTSQGATASNVKLLCCQKAIETMAIVTPNPITIGGGNPTPSTSDPY